VPKQRPKRRQAPFYAHEERRALAEDHVDSMRLGGDPQDSYLQAQFLRLRARRGAKKAIGAVAASILSAAYHMLKNGTLYQLLGAATSTVEPKQNTFYDLFIDSTTSDSTSRSLHRQLKPCLVSSQRS
jgi:hypothetical protein